MLTAFSFDHLVRIIHRGYVEFRLHFQRIDSFLLHITFTLLLFCDSCKSVSLKREQSKIVNTAYKVGEDFFQEIQRQNLFFHYAIVK